MRDVKVIAKDIRPVKKEEPSPTISVDFKTLKFGKNRDKKSGPEIVTNVQSVHLEPKQHKKEVTHIKPQQEYETYQEAEIRESSAKSSIHKKNKEIMAEIEDLDNQIHQYIYITIYSK